ncbi:MAG: hypothetical protein ACRDPI_02550 [Nocardioidaceae bacterium]
MSETLQGTVSAFDTDTASGRVLRDDGVELSFGAGALIDSRLRHLRPGQRVRWVQEGAAGEVVDLQILTLH